MIVNLIQISSTVVLVIVTIFYTYYTKSLAQTGKEPILDIKQPNILNVICALEIYNLSEFFAKDFVIKLIRKDKKDVSFNGPKVLYPQKSGLFRAIEKPFFNTFEVGDKIIIECKSILGRKMMLKYVYEKNRSYFDTETSAEFVLIDVGNTKTYI